MWFCLPENFKWTGEEQNHIFYLIRNYNTKASKINKLTKRTVPICFFEIGFLTTFGIGAILGIVWANRKKCK